MDQIDGVKTQPTPACHCGKVMWENRLHGTYEDQQHIGNSSHIEEIVIGPMKAKFHGKSISHERKSITFPESVISKLPSETISRMRDVGTKKSDIKNLR